MSSIIVVANCSYSWWYYIFNFVLIAFSFLTRFVKFVLLSLWLCQQEIRCCDCHFTCCVFSQDRPSKEEKCDMAQAIIATYPALKDASGGYVCYLVL